MMGDIAPSQPDLNCATARPVTADWYVLAVPFDRVPDLLPDELVAREPYFGNVANLTPVADHQRPSLVRPAGA